MTRTCTQTFLTVGFLLSLWQDAHASDSTGTANGINAIKTGLVDHATSSTTNDAATLSGGNVRDGTTSPTTGAEVDLTVKAAGTRNKACKASDVGAMRYNATGNYMEICSYP